MGYPLDVDAQNAALDALLSRDLTGVPTVFEVALFNAHPLFGGTELTATGGYARALINLDLTDFPAAVDGRKNSLPVSFGVPTGPWSDTAPYALMIDHADSTTRWYLVLLSQAVDVDGTETDPVEIILGDYWNTAA